MSGEVVGAIASIFAGITGVAILAVLVSKNSQTPAVINAAGNAYSSGLAVAVSPITGTGFTGNGAQTNGFSIGSFAN